MSFSYQAVVWFRSERDFGRRRSFRGGFAAKIGYEIRGEIKIGFGDEIKTESGGEIKFGSGEEKIF